MELWINLDIEILVQIAQDDDGWYVATVPCLQGVVAQGTTIAAALENVREAILLHVAGANRDGLFRGEYTRYR